MRPVRLTLLPLVLVAAATTLAQSPPMEKQLLFGGASAKGWSPAECTVEVSNAHVKVNETALHWHVPVDYYSGEAKYPIGWPRVSHAIPEGPSRDWSAWDYLHLWVYTTSSRAKLPQVPAGLGIQAHDKIHGFSMTLGDLKLGEWVEIKIPVAKIAQAGDVRGVQFHIAEANYKHQDQIDFYIDDLALLRYAQPTILDFAAETAVAFADAKVIAARFQLAGVKPGDTVPVVCELRRDGKVVASATAQAGRGPQRVVIEPTRGALTPGTYELTARAGNGQSATPATLRVVESPWRK